MARFATGDSQDHSAAVWILTLFSLIYKVLTTSVRAAIKFRMLGLDDCVAALAQLLARGNAFSVVHALVRGLAHNRSRDESDDQIHYAGTLQASIILYLLTLVAANVSTILFLRRIFRRSSHSHAMLICNTCVAILALWGVVAAVAVSVNCGPDHLWSFSEDVVCNGRERWLVVTIIDGATEIGVLAVVVWLASRLQMTVEKKFTVCVAFVWRLGLIVMAVYHYRSYHNALRSPNTEIAISRLFVWEQVIICYSLLSTTWPFTRSFIKGFNTSPLHAVSGYGSGVVELDVANSKRRMDSAISISKRPWQVWQGSGMHSSTVYSRPKSQKDEVGFGSQEMIIRRDNEITVSYGYDRAVDATSR